MDSKDRRSRRQKLRDMANQAASPYEAEIARQKLKELGPEPEIMEADHFIYVKGKNIYYSGFVHFTNWNFTVSGFGEY